MKDAFKLVQTSLVLVQWFLREPKGCSQMVTKGAWAISVRSPALLKPPPLWMALCTGGLWEAAILNPGQDPLSLPIFIPSFWEVWQCPWIIHEFWENNTIFYKLHSTCTICTSVWKGLIGMQFTCIGIMGRGYSSPWSFSLGFFYLLGKERQGEGGNWRGKGQL